MGSPRCAWDWVPSVGASRGLISILKEEFLLVEDFMQAQRALAIRFCGSNGGFQWVVANVYGPNVEAERPDILDLFANLKSQWQAPWVFGGDFNMVRFIHEKKGGSSITRTMNLFSDFISVNDLVDLPLQGSLNVMDA